MTHWKMRMHGYKPQEMIKKIKRPKNSIKGLFTEKKRDKLR
jgi:hypothetical protein